MTIAVAVLGLATIHPGELVLPGAVVAAQIQASLQGTTMVLHRNGRVVDGRPTPGSYIQFSEVLGSKRYTFSLPDKVTDLGYLGNIRYQLYDIRLKSTAVVATTSEYVITALFESSGVEMKGIHSALGDAGAPDVELDDPTLTIRLKPALTADGRVTYASPRVTFSAKVDNTAIPRFTAFGKEIDLIDLCTNYRNQLCNRIAREIKTFLDKPERQEAFAKKIDETVGVRLRGSGFAPSSLRFRGTDLVVSIP